MGLQKVRSFFARTIFYSGKVDCVKRNSSKRLFIMSVDVALSAMKNYFGRVNVSARLDRKTKSRCIVSTFFELKRGIPKPMLAQTIAIFASGLLESSKRLRLTESNAARYLPVRRKVSTSFIKWNSLAQCRAGFMTACKNTATNKCLWAMRKNKHFLGLFAFRTKSSEALSSKRAFAVRTAGGRLRC